MTIRLNMFFFFFCLAFFVVCFGNEIMASSYDSSFSTIKNNEAPAIMVDIMCNVINMVTGSIAQAIAIVALVVVGYSFFMGKVSVSMLFVLVSGMLLVFGAPEIIGLLMKGKDIVSCS